MPAFMVGRGSSCPPASCAGLGTRQPGGQAHIDAAGNAAGPASLRKGRGGGSRVGLLLPWRAPPTFPLPPSPSLPPSIPPSLPPSLPPPPACAPGAPARCDPRWIPAWPGSPGAPAQQPSGSLHSKSSLPVLNLHSTRPNSRPPPPSVLLQLLALPIPKGLPGGWKIPASCRAAAGQQGACLRRPRRAGGSRRLAPPRLRHLLPRGSSLC